MFIDIHVCAHINAKWVEKQDFHSYKLSKCQMQIQELSLFYLYPEIRNGVLHYNT